MRRSEAGFSLIEVVAALVLLSLVLGVLVEAIRGGLLADTKSGTVKRLLAEAEMRLALAGAETPLEPGARDGRDGDLSWRLSVEEFRDSIDAPEATSSAAVPTAYRVRVTVTASPGGVPRSLSLETIRLKQERRS